MGKIILEGSGEDTAWRITGNTLREARGDRTQAQVCEMLGVDQSTYSKWEAGISGPMIHYSGRLELVMGRAMSELFPNCYRTEKPSIENPDQLKLELEGEEQ